MQFLGAGSHQSTGLLGVEKLLLPKSLIEMLAQLWYKLLDTPIEEMQVLESKVNHSVQGACGTESII